MNPDYIKQCEKAGKIQSLRYHKNYSVRTKLWREGDWFLERHDYTATDDPAHGGYIEERLQVHHICDEAYFQPSDDAIWLPTQAQLQEMLPLEARSYLGPIRDFAFEQELAFGDVRLNIHVFTSMDSLWLAFVMFQLYQKRWNGSEWLTPSKK